MKKNLLLVFIISMCGFSNSQEGSLAYGNYLSVSEFNLGTGKIIPWDSMPGSDVPIGENYVIKEIEGMVFIKGGTFQMGSKDYSDEKPMHSVTISDFYIGKYEVTQKEWRDVMGSNPSYFKGDNLPVENVNWNDVQEYIKNLNVKTGLMYRLPTEAEWEYAAGGGASGRTKWAGTNSKSSLGSCAWYGANAGSKTHPVGTKNPNRLGLYDMSGNVWEWCGDWYGSYGSGSLNNPEGATSGPYRVMRGGGWFNSASGCRVTNRVKYSPTGRYKSNGFRLVLVP